MLIFSSCRIIAVLTRTRKSSPPRLFYWREFCSFISRRFANFATWNCSSIATPTPDLPVALFETLPSGEDPSSQLLSNIPCKRYNFHRWRVWWFSILDSSNRHMMNFVRRQRNTPILSSLGAWKTTSPSILLFAMEKTENRFYCEGHYSWRTF